MDFTAPEEEIRFWVHKAYRAHAPNLLCNILSIYLLVLWKELNVFLALPIILNILSKAFSAFQLYSVIKLYPSEKPLMYTIISEILFLILLIPVSFGKFHLIYAGIPLYLSNFLVSFIDYKNPCNFSLLVYFICTVINWCKSLVVICVGLRLEDTIEWGWGYLFWPVWLTNGISLAMAGAYLLALVLSGCKNLKQSTGQLWGIFSLITYPVSLILLILGFCSLFSPGPQIFSKYYLTAASLLLLHLALTLALKKPIV